VVRRRGEELEAGDRYHQRAQAAEPPTERSGHAEPSQPLPEEGSCWAAEQAFELVNKASALSKMILSASVLILASVLISTSVLISASALSKSGSCQDRTRHNEVSIVCFIAIGLPMSAYDLIDGTT
jgi:hypothetical protein